MGSHELTLAGRNLVCAHFTPYLHLCVTAVLRHWFGPPSPKTPSYHTVPHILDQLHQHLNVALLLFFIIHSHLVVRLIF